MAGIASALVGGALVSGIGTAVAQGISGRKAAGVQERAAQAGIDEQRARFEQLQKLLSPYVRAGKSALAEQAGLLGLKGDDAQKEALLGIQNDPTFLALAKQGQNAILQSASATGGLRGGNIQAALGQFRPGLLNQFIQQRLSNLGGITSLGQNSAVGVGSAGQDAGARIAQLLGQGGEARAGGILSTGNAIAGGFQGFGNALGQLAGFSGKGGF